MAENLVQHWKLYTDRCPRIINWLFQFDCKYLSNIVNAWLNPKILRQVQQQYDVEVPAVQYWETSWETCCAIRQNGWRIPQKNWWTTECQHHETHPQALLVNQIQEVVSGKHSILTHFLTDRNREVCLRTKMTRFGDLITADHKVFIEEGQSRSYRRYAVFVQDLATQGGDCVRAKPNLHRKQQNRKSFTFTLTILWNLAKLVHNYPGIIVNLRLTVPRQMVLQKEQCAELRKGHLRYCCNPAWMKNGGLTPWNVSVIFETFLLSDGKHLMNGDLENHSVGP